jgi:polysaccharide chain length determinant protein (PEP-CTERM system associated)
MNAPDVGSDRNMGDERRTRSALEAIPAIWSRRKWLAILAFAAPLAVGVSLVVSLPNIYRSSATVLVDRQQVPEAFVRSTVTGALETRLHTISQEVLSRARLEGLIHRFGLYPDLRRRRPFEDVIARMRRDINLELKSAELRGLREATVAFTISYQGAAPDTVSAVTNTLASFYIDENLKARERQATGTAEFLKVQLGETKKRLDQQESVVSGFKRRHLGELPQQMDTNLATLERLHAQLRQNADSQTRATDRRQALSGQLAEAEALMASSPVNPALVATGMPLLTPELRQARLAQKREDLARLRSQFSDRYPDVVQLISEIAALEREFAEIDAQMAKPNATAEANADTSAQPRPPTAAAITPYVLRLKETLAETQTEIKVLKTEEQRLREGIATYQARVENVPRREQEFKELSRDYESTRELYSTLLKRFEEAQLSESMEQRQKGETFRVLDAAVPGALPAAPSRARLLLLTVAAALGLAVGLVLLVERIDTSFHDIDELRAFSNVPVLGSIPLIVTQTDLHRRRWRMRLTAAAALVGFILIVGLVHVAANGNERLVLLLSRGAS